MAGKKKPGLAGHVKPIDADGAAEVAGRLAGDAPTASGPGAGSMDDLSSQSYNLPIDQIGLLADVAAARASDYRKRRVKGVGRISASSVLREVIENATADLEAELRRLRG